jgi:photosystem II stability/assembly factor-like uncharacterized protein
MRIFLSLKMFLRKLFLVVFFAFSQCTFAQTITDISDTSIHSSFRGMSVVNDNVVWVSGSKGTIGITVNGGKTWSWHKVLNFESSDFRSIYAFDEKNAIIASAGTPAVILITENGGLSWNERFISSDSAMFFDGIDFWSKSHGIIFGDPVNGRMYLSETFDGGKTWKEIPFLQRPQLDSGEAAFAASGTTIRVIGKNEVWIATGGVVSRLWHSIDGGHSWTSKKTPMLQGQPSRGIFSIATFWYPVHGRFSEGVFKHKENGIAIVGGDYANDSLAIDNCFSSADKGDHWATIVDFPHGYKSCIELAKFNHGKVRWICTGTSGSEICERDGWHAIGQGYHTVRQARKGKAVYFCGGKGTIGKLEMGN